MHRAHGSDKVTFGLKHQSAQHVSEKQTSEAHSRFLNYEIEQRRMWADWVLKLAFLHLHARDIYNPSRTATTVTGTDTPCPSLDKHSSALKVRSLPVAAQMS